MGFSTTLSLYNLRVFLHRLVGELSTQKEFQVSYTEKAYTSTHKIAGMSPQVDSLKIMKDEQVLFEVDATDDEYCSISGKKESEFFPALSRACQQGDMDAALESLHNLAK